MLARFTAARGWIGLVARLVLAGVFGWAGVAKLGDPRAFTRAVRAYDATPEWLSKTIGYGLPMLELSVAVLLLVGLITRYAAVIIGLLLVVFIGGVVQAGARGIKIECGCFGGGGGASSTTTYTLDILRDVALLLVAAYLIAWPLTKLSIDGAILKSELIPGLTTKQQRSEKNLKRYKAATAAAAVELQHKQRFIAIGTALSVLLISLIAVGVQSGRAKITGTVDTASASATTGVRVGNQAAPVTVDLYEDFQCPICNSLEQTLGSDLAAKVKATSVKVNYHVMSFLDASSNGNQYSTRAANAGYCASDVSADAFAKLHAVLFGKSSGADNQPAENSKGRSDAQLIAYAKTAGISSADFSSCVTSQTHKPLVEAVTEAASKKGVNGTPTVFVDDKQVQGSGGGAVTSAQVDAAIALALSSAKSSGAPSPTPSVSPAASSSSSSSVSSSVSGAVPVVSGSP